MNNSFRDLLVENLKEAKVILTGLPYDLAASVGKGASLAPKTIRELSSYLPALTMDGKSIKACKIYDAGDIEINDNYYQTVEEKTYQLFENDLFKLFIGGDHSVTIPLEKNFAKVMHDRNIKPVIVHIDAHPDICDFYDGSSYSHACTNARALENGYLDEDIIMVGIRGFEEQEVTYFNNGSKVKVFNANSLNELGFSQVIDYLKDKYQDNYAIYLSYDIDANDPSFAPGTGTPEAFGLNSRSLMLFIKELFKQFEVKAMDIVEVSPALDCNNITSWLALKTLYEIFEIINLKKEIK